jgi:RND family efflux transporter MFP subunit
MAAAFKSIFFLCAITASLVVIPLRSFALEVQAVTTPSADITLSFVVSGKVAEILVKEGDTVEKGTLLASLDDGPERIQTEQLKVQAANKTRILSAKAELAQKMVDLEKLEAARMKGAASDWEVEQMKLSVRIAELSLKAARIEHEQNGRQYAQAMHQLKRMRIVSPVSGRVEKVSAEAGEVVEKARPVVQLVKTDPLWLDVPVPLPRAKQLAMGQRVTISFSGDPAGESADARIVHISSVADAASDTLRVRIEVGNPSRRPAGEQVTVGFPPIQRGKAAGTLKN